MPLPTLDADFAASPYGGDAWVLAADSAVLALAQTPAVLALGDGFVGMRGPGDADGAPRVYLNGVFEQTPIVYHEAAHGYARSSDSRVAVADATRIDVEVDGVMAVPEAAQLDLARGILTETRVAGPVTLTIETLVAMARRGVVATRIRVVAERDAGIVIRRTVTAPPGDGAEADGIYDPRVTPTTGVAWGLERLVDQPNVVGRVDRLPRSSFGVAAVVRPLDEAFRLAAGEVRTIDGLAAYAASRGGDPLPLALAALDGAGDYDRLAAEQAAWFAEFWAEAGVELPDPRAAQALRHGLFQLVQAVGRDGTASLSAKGQSGEGYEGHVFWDAEIYALPVFVHLAPTIARGMLRWRIERLAAARDNARLMGHIGGALYPWRTIAGAECSSFFPAGAAQYHINADIAYALQLYVDTTGDRSILAEGGAEMLAETARIWLDIGFHDPARGGAFVINRVTGPDEYSALVDNSLYTNLMAAAHLRYAAAEGNVAPDEAAAMLRAADAMFVAHDPAHDVPAQDDRFFALDPWPFETTPADRYPLLLHYHPLTIYRHRVAKQADAVLAAVLLPDAFDAPTRRRMLDVYEAVTVHDSTLSASAFATLAAQAGQTARAAAYWRSTLLTDLADLHGNSGHGLHMAALAGGWTTLAFGLAGVRTRGGVLRFAPVTDAGDYALQVRFRGSLVRLELRGGTAHYRLVSGAPVSLQHHGETIMLDDTVSR